MKMHHQIFDYTRHLILLVLTGSGFFMTGCASLLPSAMEYTENPWKSYEEVESVYNKIIPGKTTVQNLADLGFNPNKTPNIMTLNYLDIIHRFMPNQAIRIEDLDPAIQSCFKMKESCTGYKVTPEMIVHERYGSLFLDIFNFNRKTRISGWRFEALFVMIDNLVVYKLSSGQPNVLRDESKRNPLGPLQDIKIDTPSIDLNGS